MLKAHITIPHAVLLVLLMTALLRTLPVLVVKLRPGLLETVEAGLSGNLVGFAVAHGAADADAPVGIVGSIDVVGEDGGSDEEEGKEGDESHFEVLCGVNSDSISGIGVGADIWNLVGFVTVVRTCNGGGSVQVFKYVKSSSARFPIFSRKESS